jgi:hypothetical protein
MAAIKKRFPDCESGTVLIEAAITLPLLLLVVLGIVDFGRLFQRYEVVTNAAREGARVAVLPGYDAADVVERSLQYLDAGGLDRDLADPPPVYQAPAPVPIDGGPCITLVGVTVTYPHTYSFVGGIMNFFGTGFSSTTLTATALMRSETMAMACPPPPPPPPGP